MTNSQNYYKLFAISMEIVVVSECLYCL